MGCPKKLWMLCPWRCLRQGRMKIWATWFGERCPCLWQQGLEVDDHWGAFQPEPFCDYISYLFLGLTKWHGHFRWADFSSGCWLWLFASLDQFFLWAVCATVLGAGEFLVNTSCINETTKICTCCWHGPLYHLFMTETECSVSSTSNRAQPPRV